METHSEYHDHKLFVCNCGVVKADFVLLVSFVCLFFISLIIEIQ